MPDQNGQDLYPFSEQDSSKNIPLGPANTYLAYDRRVSPGMGVGGGGGVRSHNLLSARFILYDSAMRDY